MYLAYSSLGQVTKFNPKILNVFWTWLEVKEEFVQLAFKSQKLSSFRWLWKRAKCDPNGIKIAIIFQKIKKIAQRLGDLPPGAVCGAFELH